MKKCLRIFLAAVIVCCFAGCCSSHSFEESSRVAATCEAAGSVTQKCTNCGQEETTVLPATGHTYTEEILREASCTAAGLKKMTCSGCGAQREGAKRFCTVCGHDFEAKEDNRVVEVKVVRPAAAVQPDAEEPDHMENAGE